MEILYTTLLNILKVDNIRFGFSEILLVPAAAQCSNVRAEWAFGDEAKASSKYLGYTQVVVSTSDPWKIEKFIFSIN